MSKAREVIELLKEKLDKGKIVSEIEILMKSSKAKSEVMKLLKDYDVDSKDLKQSVMKLSDRDAEDLMSELLTIEV